MGKIRDWFCRHLCVRRVSDSEIARRAALPMEVRKASHELSNAAMSVRGSQPRVKEQANVFLELAKAMRAKEGINR